MKESEKQELRQELGDERFSKAEAWANKNIAPGRELTKDEFKCMAELVDL